MRRLATFAVVAFAACAAYVALPTLAHAQAGGGGGEEDEDAKKKKRDEEWGDNHASLPALRNAGPCPFVKTLYDAARYVEFKDGHEGSANVAWSGEVQGISAGCEYKDAEPIKVTMEILFALGRGPQAQGETKTYRYWVAVTERNTGVLAKETFDLPVKFAAGQDRVFAREQIGRVTIPRAKLTTSGSNFEILVGFEVTPQMAEFNREGKRFRLNAGTTAAAAGTTPSTQ